MIPIPSRRSLVHAAPVVAAITVGVALVHALVRVVTEPTWLTVGDESITIVRSLDVFSAHPPLVGPYSRVGWDHPGPMLFWLLALPVRLFGDPSRGAALAAVVITAGASLWTLQLMHRLLRGAGVIAGSAALLLLFVWNPVALWSVWGPAITLVPLLLFFVSTCSAVMGDYRSFLPLVISGHFLVQTHAGYVPVVVVGFIVTAGLVVKRRRERTPFARPSVPALSVAIAGLLTLPVVVDQVIGSGNAGRMIEWFLSDRTQSVGLGDATSVLASQLLINPISMNPSVGRELFITEPSRSPSWIVAMFLVILFFLVVSAHIRGDRLSRTITAWSGVMIVVSAFAFSRSDGLHGWVVHWGVVVSVMVWMSIGVAGLRLWLLPGARFPALLLVSLVAVAFLLPQVVGSTGERQFAAGAGVSSSARSNQRYAMQRLLEIIPEKGSFTSEISTWILDRGPVLALISHDRNFVVPRDIARIWGEHRSIDSSSDGPLWSVHFVNGSFDSSLDPSGPGWSLVWSTSRFTNEERDLLRSTRMELFEALQGLGLDSTVLAEELVFFDKVSQDCSVFSHLASTCQLYNKLAARGREARLWVKRDELTAVNSAAPSPG